jgi:hypothetical protein
MLWCRRWSATSRPRETVRKTAELTAYLVGRGVEALHSESVNDLDSFRQKLVDDFQQRLHDEFDVNLAALSASFHSSDVAERRPVVVHARRRGDCAAR